jgi:hypothetical protein
MALRVLGIFLLALSMLAPATGGKARTPAVTSHSATYDFYLGGIWAGVMAVDADFGAGTYRAGVTAHISGIVGLFLTAGVEAETVGRIDAGGLSPQQFTADFHERRHRQVVDISYADGSVASVRAEPAYQDRQWSISADDQPGVPDPLSAAFGAFAPAFAADVICGHTIDVFDGERRWAIEIDPPQAVTGDGRIRCDSVYVRVAGFDPELMGAKARRPFALFLEQRGNGLFHVVRVIGQTSFGLAVLLLRE